MQKITYLTAPAVILSAKYLHLSEYFCNFNNHNEITGMNINSGNEKYANLNAKRLDFLRAVSLLRKKNEHKGMDLKSLCLLAATSQAPQFYLSTKQALEIYNIWKKTGNIPCQSENDQAKYIEVFRRFELSFNGKKPHRKYTTMGGILASPAPSFYLSYTGILDFYYRAIKYKRSLAQK